MRLTLLGLLLRILPKNLLSRFTGRLVRLRLPPPFRGLLLRWFANRYNLALGDAEYDLRHYKSIGDLFTRRLKPGIRPIGDRWVHPVDGQLTIAGRISAGQLIQAKDWTYKVGEFLGDFEAVADFEGGSFFTYYLCPTDYHRVHSPIDGSIFKAEHIPGTLWPVNEWSVTHVPKLFSVNERVVIWIQSAYGPVAVVLVGATNVGEITLSFDKTLVSNRSNKDQRVRYYDPALLISRGEELGVFNMGSTVVVLYPKNFPLTSLPSERYVHMGEALV